MRFSIYTATAVLSSPPPTADSQLSSLLSTFSPAYSLLFPGVASAWKTASSVGAVRMASPQASNAGSEALLNFSVAHAGNAPKRRSKSLFSSFDSPSTRLLPDLWLCRFFLCWWCISCLYAPQLFRFLSRLLCPAMLEGSLTNPLR